MAQNNVIKRSESGVPTSIKSEETRQLPNFERNDGTIIGTILDSFGRHIKITKTTCLLCRSSVTLGVSETITGGRRSKAYKILCEHMMPLNRDDIPENLTQELIPLCPDCELIVQKLRDQHDIAQQAYLELAKLRESIQNIVRDSELLEGPAVGDSTGSPPKQFVKLRKVIFEGVRKQLLIQRMQKEQRNQNSTGALQDEDDVDDDIMVLMENTPKLQSENIPPISTLPSPTLCVEDLKADIELAIDLVETVMPTDTDVDMEESTVNADVEMPATCRNVNECNQELDNGCEAHRINETDKSVPDSSSEVDINNAARSAQNSFDVDSIIDPVNLFPSGTSGPGYEFADYFESTSVENAFASLQANLEVRPRKHKSGSNMEPPSSSELKRQKLNSGHPNPSKPIPAEYSTKRNSHTTNRIKCEICRRHFASAKGLALHKQVVHQIDIGHYYKCPFCDVNISWRGIFLKHIKSKPKSCFDKRPPNFDPESVNIDDCIITTKEREIAKKN